ncbi:MAG: putative Ig domain-containing protein [Chthoniobacteraceae bacterium]
MAPPPSDAAATSRTEDSASAPEPRGPAQPVAISVRSLPTLREGTTVSLPLGGAMATGTVHLVARERGGWLRVAGSLQAPAAGSFAMGTNGRDTAGLIQIPGRRLGYIIAANPLGDLVATARPLAELLCLPLPRPTFEPTTPPPGTRSPSLVPPILSSRPGATAVLYLDFDGETVTDPLWNSGRTIVAKAAASSNADITSIWRRVKEDFLAFDVDVTTDPARYTTAPVGRRMRCIITPTDIAARGAGGVAYVGSFAEAGTAEFSSTIPCWVFNTSVNGIAEAISHEFGHTLGLHHDGRTSPAEGYFAGQGTGATGWAPIMGVSYYKSLTQWSKGEYLNANNTQDDLAIISGAANGFGYTADEAAAAPLIVEGDSIEQPGVIASASDTDTFVFSTAGGLLNITATPAPLSPDLDIVLDLLDDTGALLESDNPAAALPASLSRTVPSGVYHLRVRGTGAGNVLATGYTAYASIGEYTLAGTIPGAPPQPAITSAGTAAGEVGVPFSYQIAATNSPDSFALIGTLPAGLDFEAGTGLISGTPTTAGMASLTIEATNGAGTGSKALTITIAPAQAPVITSPGTAPGNVGVAFTYQITASHNPASFDLTGTLPPGLTFTAGTGVLSGTPTTVGTYPLTMSATNPNGTDTVPLTVSISPASGTPTPLITSAGFAAARVDVAFSYQIIASNNPTTFSLTGTLPLGLGFTAATGVIAGMPAEGGVFTVTLGAANAGGTGTRELQISVEDGTLDLTAALDQADLVWTTLGPATWAGETAVTHDGVDAAAATTVGDDQFATMETDLTGPASLRFFWKVSSEPDYDYLSFSIDGEERARISGQADWQLKSYPIGPGTHRITFRYRRDATTAGGGNGAWVDEVSVFAREGLPGSDSFVGAQALTGTHVEIETSNVGATTEPGEQGPFGGSYGHSLWWMWTAPESGRVVASTAGSTFDTILGIYTGAELGRLVPVAVNDDLARANRTSRVTFRAVAGQTYYITIGGFANLAGLIDFDIHYVGRGTFAGIIQPDAGVEKTAGLVTLTVTDQLAYTMQVLFEGRRYVRRGSLAAGLDAPALARRGGLPPLDITLTTDLDNGDNAVKGTMTVGGEGYHLTARRRISGADLLPLAAGGYTMLLEPATLGGATAYGAGYGRATVTSRGEVRFSGTLPDGRRAAQGGVLTAGNLWPCYLAPYRGAAGTLAGEVLFDPVVATNFTGALRWRVEDPAALISGEDVTLKGSYYFRPNPGAAALFVTPGANNLDVGFTHRDALSDPSDPTVTLDTSSVVLGLPPGFALRLNARMGLFSGYLPDAITTVRRKMGGALLQSENRGAGLFDAGAGHGKTELVPVP